MEEGKTADNGANRCLTRNKDDTGMLNPSGMEAQEVVILGHHYPLLPCGVGELLLIRGAAPPCFVCCNDLYAPPLETRYHRMGDMLVKAKTNVGHLDADGIFDGIC